MTSLAIFYFSTLNKLVNFVCASCFVKIILLIIELLLGNLANDLAYSCRHQVAKLSPNKKK